MVWKSVGLVSKSLNDKLSDQHQIERKGVTNSIRRETIDAIGRRDLKKPIESIQQRIGGNGVIK